MVITATSDFLGGKKRVESNGLSRLHSFDVSLKTEIHLNDDVLLTPWQHDDTTPVALVVICTHLSACG